MSREGQRVAGRAFVAVLAPGRDGEGRPTEGSRLGLAVGRRVGNAIVRNRIKRGVREWFRQHRCELAREGTEADPIDLVVIARAPAAELDANGIGRELEGLIK